MRKRLLHKLLSAPLMALLVVAMSALALPGPAHAESASPPKAAYALPADHPVLAEQTGLACAPPDNAALPELDAEMVLLGEWLDGLEDEASGTVSPDRASTMEIAQATAPEPAEQASDAATAGDENCLTCHANAGLLMGLVTAPEAPPEDGCASAPSRPHFLGAFVNAEFTQSLHGQLGCVACHGGDDTTTDFTSAHADMRSANESCADCHADIVELHETSLHKTLSGMAHALKLRSGEENFATLDPMWQADCQTCHTDCSDCHLTLPNAVGGGLIKGHEFLRRAPMEDSCALCHGSRAGAEYLGQFEGIEPDIHFEKGMHCLDCHRNDLHGDGNVYTSRWQVEGRAQCTDCHLALPNTNVAAHNTAHEDVACQVCHAQPYQNCFDCHTGETDGAYFRSAGSKELLIKFGRNTAEGYPHDIVTLRNNPVARDSFDHFGTELMPDFDAHPTWKTAAPHNIRRITPQNQSCSSCHDDESLYLAPADIDADDAAANTEVVLPEP